MISPVPVGLNRTVIVFWRLIQITTKWANPSVAILDPSDEWINVSPAVFAADDRVIFEGDRGHFLSCAIFVHSLAIWSYCDGKWDIRVLKSICSTWDIIGSATHL